MLYNITILTSLSSSHSLIDYVVAIILMSLGLMFLPPANISLPLKILLFVLVDGWGLITKSLVNSFI